LVNSLMVFEYGLGLKKSIIADFIKYYQQNSNAKFELLS
jgi:hypothetical protein